MAERAGEPALADAGGAADHQIVVRVDQGAVRELVEQRAIEAARGAIVDVLDRGVMAQPS